jgi:hypothetical protein
MPSNTTDGLPYPLPTEPVKDGAVSIQNLATALDSRGNGFYTQRGTSTWTIPSNGVFVHVFPLKFARAPIIVKYNPLANGTAFSALVTVEAGNPFTYQCRLMIFSINRVSPYGLAPWSGALTCNWELTGPGPLVVYP